MSLLGGLFGGGGGNSGIGTKSTQSITENKSESNYTDKSANAGGTGSLAVGENANVTIQNLSEGVALGAINAGVKQTEFVVNSLKSITEQSAQENEATRNSADLSLRSTQGLLSALQETAASTVERGQNPEATSLSKVLIPVLIALSVIAGLFFWSRKKSSS